MSGVRRIAVLPGDGIGPEVTAEAERVLRAVAAQAGLDLELTHHPIGATALRQGLDPLPPETATAVVAADAVLLGAVGHPDFDQAPRDRRPEAGLLALRALLGVYANLRPVLTQPALAGRSPLRPELVEGVDLVIVRELTGGLYYGEPRARLDQVATNTLSYTVDEIERVAQVAFELARKRRRQLTSVDKANVLEVSQLWRDTVNRVALAYPDVRVDHLYVDYAAMRIVANPRSLDVVLTENMFGDILSDEAAVLVGSLGLLPSASLGHGPGLYEPIHGSAPDIAGQGIANPIGAILSGAMLLRHSLGRPSEADAVERAVHEVLAAGARTRDLSGPDEPWVGTSRLGELITRAVEVELERGAASSVR